MDITGIIEAISPTQTVSDKFRKREFVVAISEDVNGSTYTNYAKFQTTQAKCDLLDKSNVGDTVKVSFNIKGNKWEKDGKVNFITNLEAWRIETVAKGSSNYNPQASPNAENLPF